MNEARKNPSYLNLWNAHRQIRRLESMRPDGKRPELRTAVIGSSTLDPLAACLDTLIWLEGFWSELYVGGFNLYRQESLDPSSPLYRFRPDIVILNVDAWSLLDREFISSFVRMSLEERVAAQKHMVESLTSVVGALVKNSSATVIVSNFIVPSFTPIGIADNRQEMGLREFFSGANSMLEDRLRHDARVFLLDLDAVAGEFGKSRMTNWNTYYRGSVLYGEDFSVVLARAYMRYIRALKGKSRKCIVLDLDNTLWGGIIGEDGYDGIKLSNVSPGNEYMDFQRALLSLYSRGVILAVNSKNNPDDALRVIREHPYQLLREEHFAALRINWQDKVQNIREIAEEIGIGLDSLVFIDDNPHEREQMRLAVPEVLVPEWPKNPHLYRQALESLDVFDVLTITREDIERGQMYAGRRKRAQLESQATSLEEFLRNLGLKVTVRLADDFTTPRVTQLINKTNQFNLTTRRYTEAEVQRLRDSDSSAVYCMNVEDKFGDEGLVGVAIVKKSPDEWYIDSFLMSCRVIGRSAETALLARIVRDAKAAGVRSIRGEFIPTKKNPPARDFYERHGFSMVSTSQDGTVTWTLDLSEKSVEVPEWIELLGE